MDTAQFSKDMKILLSAKVNNLKVDEDKLLGYHQKVQNIRWSAKGSSAELLAFWLNLYNGLTNFQILELGLRKSVKEVPDFFTRKVVKVNRFPLSLDEIEHGILRQNRPRKDGEKLENWNCPDDPVFHLSFEPRIHFALNCGAQSCPAIAFYAGRSLDTQLKLSQAHFVAEGFLVDERKKRVECNAIFDWYRSDFPELFLNDPKYVDFEIRVLHYEWKFR